MNPEENKPEPSPLRQIRTFQGDVAATIGNQKESLVSISRAEHKKNPVQPEEKGGRNTFLYLVGSLMLFALAGGGGWYAYQEFARKTAPPVIVQSPNRLISAARTAEVSSAAADRGGIIDAVAQESASAMPAGQVTHINVPLTSQEFFKALSARMQSSLLRAFKPEFMLGALGGESGGVFMIMPLASFENAFAGMLAWEPRIAEDIGPLFNTRAQLRDLPQETQFEDALYKNRHVRALYAPGGDGEERQELLVYAFFNNDTLVVAENSEALETVLGRLSAELLSR